MYYQLNSVLPEWDNGEIIAPDEPGMGLHLDASVLEEYKVYQARVEGNCAKGETYMGTFSVDVVVGNPDSAARETAEALVVTGATFSVMPESLLRGLGIQPTRTRRLRLANGRVEERQTGMAFFEVNGIDCEAMVVFGPEDLYLLGATTLEALLLIVDPINKQLVPEVGLLMRGGDDDSC